MWNPLLLPGCKLWLDATQIKGIADGARINEIPNLANMEQKIKKGSANGPVFRNSINEGRPALVFTDAEWMFWDDSSPFEMLSATVIMVLRFNLLSQPNNNYDYLYAIGSNLTTNTRTVLAPYRNHNDNRYSMFNGVDVVYGPTITGQKYLSFIQRHRFEELNNELWIDSVAQTVPQVPGSIPKYTEDARFYIGTRWHSGVGHFLNGNVCELIFFDRPLTDIELDQIQRYVNWKWFDDVYPDFFDGDINNFKNLRSTHVSMAEVDKNFYFYRFNKISDNDTLLIKVPITPEEGYINGAQLKLKVKNNNGSTVNIAPIHSDWNEREVRFNTFPNVGSPKQFDYESSDGEVTIDISEFMGGVYSGDIKGIALWGTQMEVDSYDSRVLIEYVPTRLLMPNMVFAKKVVRVHWEPINSRAYIRRIWVERNGVSVFETRDISITSFIDEGLNPNTQYEYRLYVEMC